MPELGVVVVTPDDEQRALLQLLIDGSTVARMSHAFSTYPAAGGDPTLRRIQDLRPDVVVVDLHPDNLPAAVHGIELLHASLPKAGIFAVGDIRQAQVIVSAMRAGASEFLEKPVSSAHVLEAFSRFVTSQRKLKGTGARGKIYTVLNAKGGNGATTVAVNTALALAGSHGSTALVDIAPLGNAALHLNLRPSFTINDAIGNLHRLDASLLDGLMARHETGVHVLAGHPGLQLSEAPGSEFARLFDVLAGHYRSVVVDASTRLDATVRTICDFSDLVLLVANPDLSSLWSAAQVKNYFVGSAAEEKLRLVLNRYRKISGFSDSEIEGSTKVKIVWKVPNHYAAIASSIERGMPVTQQNHSDIARCFVDFSALLTRGVNGASAKRRLFGVI